MDLENKKTDKLQYTTKTQQIALYSALAIGLLISISGIRIICTFVEIPSVNSENGFNEIQLNIFYILDIFLTGGLLAGGSDNIHKIMETFRAFLDLTTKSSTSKRDQLNS